VPSRPVGSLRAPPVRGATHELGRSGEVVRRFYKQFGAGSIDAALSVFADDLEVIDPVWARSEAATVSASIWRCSSAMPDASANVEQTVESGELAAVEGRVAGTNTGPLATGVAEVGPTRAAIELRFADVSRMREGSSLLTAPTTTSSGS